MAIYRDKISEVDVNKQFAEDVYLGLSSDPKYLSSKYFYDEIGDKLFIQIMNLEEYYLTGSEMEILKNQSVEIVKPIIHDHSMIEVIELGAGDGSKTVHFLEALKNHDFIYKPLDISPFAIKDLERKLEHIPWLKTKGLVGDYFELLESLNSSSSKVILFLGSNLGNMPDEKASEFIQRIDTTMNKGDYFLLGLDLKKEHAIVSPAYNDSKGITAQFNLNLLNRINRELGADFRIENFEHAPNYDEDNGIAYSFIQSKVDQVVSIDLLNEKFKFKKGEKIHTEISRKYNDDILNQIIENTSLYIHSKYYDNKKYYCNYLLNKQ